MLWTKDMDEKRINLVKGGCTPSHIAKVLTLKFNKKVTPKNVSNKNYYSKITAEKENKFFDDFTNNVYNNLENNVFEQEPAKWLNDFCYNYKPKETNKQQNNIVNNAFNDAKIFDRDTSMENKLVSKEKLTLIKKIYDEINVLNPKKILSLSDLHSPFVHMEAVEKAVNDNLDADICILNGDIFDNSAMSTFDKLTETDFESELQQIDDLLSFLNSKFKKIIWVGGNHDYMRGIRFVSRMFPNSLKKYALEKLDIIKNATLPYKNITIVQHDWVEIGDCIFAHLENFSSVDMKTVVTNNNIFDSIKETLPNRDFEAIVIGHTHAAGKIIRNGTVLIEQGCLCWPQDYRFMKPTTRSWQLGYAVVYMNDMKVDKNKTNFVII